MSCTYESESDDRTAQHYHVQKLKNDALLWSFTLLLVKGIDLFHLVYCCTETFCITAKEKYCLVFLNNEIISCFMGDNLPQNPRGCFLLLYLP